MVQEYKVLVYEDRTEWLNMEGQLHRVDGPAVVYNDGKTEWWVNGQLHRIDGPAIECFYMSPSWLVNKILSGTKGLDNVSYSSEQWWIEGNRLTEEEWKKKVNPVKELTIDEISKRLGYEVKIVKS